MSGTIEHKVSEEVRKWLKLEEAEQRRRYQQIVKEMDDLDGEREAWVAAFLQRIQTEGFNLDGDTKIKIPAEKIPEKPANKKMRVVF